MDNQPIFIELESQSIASCPVLPPELKFIGKALQHQVDVFELSRNNDLILDEAPTGTGKTKAGLSVLLHQPNKSAVYIAPTNALITQQTEAAEKFIRDAGLPHIVKAASSKDIKAWPDDKVEKRSGEKLYNVLRNPATIFPEVGANRPILLVTNPDIFYYACFFAYNKLDKTNIASQFYSKFSTVIFDEFHLYSAKQLVSLFFYIALSDVFGFFKNKRRVVLLTATPEPACEQALKVLSQQGVKIAKVDGLTQNNYQLPSQTRVHLEIRPQKDQDEWMSEMANKIEKYLEDKPDQYGAVILDSLYNINWLAELLKNKGLKEKFGRITGPIPAKDRFSAAQKKVILATSTVDVGFNFERVQDSSRQNLDWLIFSARDRFSFWQRLGRVGRVLGKTITDIPSEAIAYLNPKAWEQGIASVDTSGGRKALQEMLNNLACLERPFLDIYWRSEAFLEIARPLLELEESLENLDQLNAVTELYHNMQEILGGKKEWSYYRYRMKILKGAEEITKKSIKDIQKNWKHIKGGQALVKTFIKSHLPEHWEKLESKEVSLEKYEKYFQEQTEATTDLKKFAEYWSILYSPIFQFRESLFESLPISDPNGVLLDEAGETNYDPIHLLRYIDFLENKGIIVITKLSDTPYDLRFQLHYHGTGEDFKNKELNRLNAFPDCRITRSSGGAIIPTPLLTTLQSKLLPGVIISTEANQGVIIQLRKQGLISYTISVSCSDSSREKDYTFFPSLSGILAIAMSGVKLKLPDGEDFYLV